MGLDSGLYNKSVKTAKSIIINCICISAFLSKSLIFKCIFASDSNVRNKPYECSFYDMFVH